MTGSGDEAGARALWPVEVIRGNPTATELRAIAAALQQLYEPARAPSSRTPRGWAGHEQGLRRGLLPGWGLPGWGLPGWGLPSHGHPGPGAWVASTRRR